MQLSRERIYYLLKSYTDGTATKAEENELFEWVTTAAGEEEALKHHIKQLIRQHERAAFPEVDWRRIYRKIWKNAGIGHRFYPRRKRLWVRMAAAVLILILGTGAVYLLLPWKGEKQTSETAGEIPAAFKNDIKPGGTKAILKAGNSSVTLTSTDTSFSLAGNQVNIRNGDVRIAKANPVKYTLVVPRGGTYRLVLADGTKVWLNADSKLIYPSLFTGPTREVYLEGEAYFEVKLDAIHPFIVKLPSSSIPGGKKRSMIRVLGTAFNVQAYPDEKNAITTLVKGKIAVSSPDKKLVLTPGQQVQMDHAGEFNLNLHADVHQAVAWKNGYFRFDRKDIHSIMKQLARWYDIKVNYSESLPTHYFGAIISRDNNISGILRMLEATGDVHFKIEGKEVTVMP